MTPKEAEAKIRECITELEEKVPTLVLSFGTDLSVRVKKRIVLRGEGKEGKFPAYTKQYAAYKKAKGKESEFRNLSFTDSMMTNYGAFKEGNQYKIGFDSKKELEKAEWNTKSAKVTNIVEPSQEEIDKGIEIFEKQILNILKKYLV